MNLAEALAGHAGDADIAVPMPHEVMGGIAVLIVLGVILVVLAGWAVWLLRKIERRLRPSD
jgi:hypothetical protein